VVGLAELFATGEFEPEEKAPNLRIMKRNSDLLLTLINDILDLSRVEAQKMKIEKEIFSLRDFVHQIVEALSLKAQEKSLLIRLDIESGVPEILRSDSVRLRQIIYNVLGNAIKFTERGEIQMSVKIENSQLSFLFRDTGIGMSAELQKNLFSVFTQGDDGHNRKFGGTGLGLALSKKLAQLLGGDLVLLESKINGGSTFRLTLPLD
jgi:signal transduction histidine kinase